MSNGELVGPEEKRHATEYSEYPPRGSRVSNTVSCAPADDSQQFIVPTNRVPALPGPANHRMEWHFLDAAPRANHHFRPQPRNSEVPTPCPLLAGCGPQPGVTRSAPGSRDCAPCKRHHPRLPLYNPTLRPLFDYTHQDNKPCTQCSLCIRLCLSSCRDVSQSPGRRLTIRSSSRQEIWCTREMNSLPSHVFKILDKWILRIDVVGYNCFLSNSTIGSTCAARTLVYVCRLRESQFGIVDAGLFGPLGPL